MHTLGDEPLTLRPVPLYHAGQFRLSGSEPSELRGGEIMTWEAPAFTEVNMSAEINAYQDDFDREQDDRF